ncbi:exosome component EXOSC1/CSL4 protein [Gregarina niphandrodes]|uniref:Exosome component EXOSC1/CSL4 protein n=1 Tax=Gregarina niphandrodes TaxID=110365 RepID=A0A023BCC1_GRENI|nr:exosome component EXOSC1/CSL4 protein [Gregarina niphandrodes]EZG82415.1 exosome component EXOSC1/CSL4 protein [Gregarina niphandrodes]|eukprot:XP_011128984.1 exosome component EXOSC1/CSL4 protein [Gregarina niphandrodes]
MEQGDWGAVLEPEEEVEAVEVEAVEMARSKELSVESEVVARVVKVLLQEVRCDVLRIDGVDLKPPCKGCIRHTDVMPLGIDKYDLLDCVRPGDILRTRLVATGLSKTLLLTTAPPDCGVTAAASRCCNAPLRPVASSLMRCSCGTLEYRKAAKT